MSNSVTNSGIQHLGWCRLPEKQRIRTEEAIDALIQKNLLSPQLKADVDLTQRDIVILPFATSTQQEHIGVKKITNKQVHVVSFSPPGAVGQTSFGSQSIILSVPKNTKEPINIDNTHEFYSSDALRDAETEYLDACRPRNAKVDYPLRKPGLTEESMQQQDWYKNLNEQEQSQAKIRLQARLDHQRFKKDFYSNFESTVTQKLMGKDYNP